MAAPINFGQMQQQVTQAIWFIDMVSGPKSTGALLKSMKEELEAIEKTKSELEIGRDFKAGVQRLERDTEKAKDDLKAARAKVKEARDEAVTIVADAQKKSLKVEETRTTLDGVRADLKKQKTQFDAEDRRLDEREVVLDKKSADLIALQDKLDESRDKLHQEAERLRGVQTQLGESQKIKI